MRLLPPDFTAEHKKLIGAKCPTCKEFDLRTMQNSATMDYFIGCSGWPECKYTEPFKVESKDQILFGF